MGKITGFLEYERKTNPEVAPSKRVKDFSDFHDTITADERRKQGARCMDCGVPFCQSGCEFGGKTFGCPLHNLIPEWNDMIFAGNYEHALSRLLKTNDFPEFTGRVCPALCEDACVCGAHDGSVTIRENELSIVEWGFKNGVIRPRIPKQRTGKKVAVIGSGPAGLAAADQLNHRGHQVTVFERDDRIGGLLAYGIPNMKLPKEIVERRVRLMESEGVEFHTCVDVGKDVSAEQIMSEYDCVILCCGAGKPREFELSGNGVEYALPYLKAATKAVLDGETPETVRLNAKGKDVVVVGAGATSSDCVATAIRQGCRSVVQIIRKPKELVEGHKNLWDEEISDEDYAEAEAEAMFGASPRRYQTIAKELLFDADGNLQKLRTAHVDWLQSDSGKLVMTESADGGETISAQMILVASGFEGCEDDVCEAFGVKKGRRGTAATRGTQSYLTDADNVFTAGDMGHFRRQSRRA